MTLPELERAIVAVGGHAGPLRAAPGDRRGRITWTGTGYYQAVTFNPELFDQHPNTLQLLTYGGGLLEEILQAVEPPVDSVAGGEAIRCAQASPWPLVGFYGAVEGCPIRSLAELRAVLEKGQAAQLKDDRRQ